VSTDVRLTEGAIVEYEVRTYSVLCDGVRVQFTHHTHHRPVPGEIIDRITIDKSPDAQVLTKHTALDPDAWDALSILALTVHDLQTQVAHLTRVAELSAPQQQGGGARHEYAQNAQKAPSAGTEPTERARSVSE
jgi:hypothetical protein